jgi:putative ABC transport system permease protein
MFSLFGAFSVPYLQRRWERAFLIICSIALGVATLVSSEVINRLIDSLTKETSTPVAVGELLISNGELGIDASVLPALEKAKIAGVSQLLPVTIDRVQLEEIPDRSAVLFGTRLPKSIDAGTGDLQQFGMSVEVRPQALSALLTGQWCLISRDLWNERKQLGISENKPLQVRIGTRIEPISVLAILDVQPNSPASVFAKNLMIVEVNLALQLTKNRPLDASQLLSSSLAAGWDTFQVGRLNRIDVVLDRGTDPKTIQPKLQEIVEKRGLVRTIEQQKKSTEDIVGGLKIGFTLCSAAVLVVGLFLVYNALAVSVTERRREIGILRALGATRVQVGSLFSLEAFFLGLIGSLAGLPFGQLLARFAIDQLREELEAIFQNDTLNLVQIDWWIAIIAVTAGTITSTLASLIPSIQAANDEPAEAVRRRTASSGGIYTWIHRITCLVLIIGGLLMVSLRGVLPPRLGSYVGLVIALTGLFMAMPIFVGIFAAILSAIVQRVGGLTARMAADNLVRSPARTGLVIGALAAGVSLMFQTAGVGKSNEIPIRAWLKQVLCADGFVFWGNLAAANSSATPVESRVALDIENNVPGVESVVRLRFYRPEFRGVLIYLLAVDAKKYHDSVRKRIPTGLEGLTAFPKLSEGDFIVASDNFLAKNNIKVGETIAVAGPSGPVELKIIGSGQDYSWNQGTVFMDRERYIQRFQDESVDMMHVYFDQQADRPETLKKLDAYTSKIGLASKDREFLDNYLTEVINRIYKLAYLQQIVIALVAALGVVNTLLIAVLQRRREIGLLRAVGATRSQVMWSVLAEATLMGILGTVLGLCLGLPMEWYTLNVLIFEESGFQFDTLIPWKETLGIGLLAILSATLAGLIPAFHAVRLRIADAIAYE